MSFGHKLRAARLRSLSCARLVAPAQSSFGHKLGAAEVGARHNGAQRGSGMGTRWEVWSGAGALKLRFVR